MRKLILLVSFFLFTPGMLFLSIFLLSYHNGTAVKGISTYAKPIAYAALPDGAGSIETSADITDRRIQSLQDFFSTYNSPLTPYAPLIVQKADQYGIDYRLLPAIAMQESGLCKKALAASPFNCWGFGIYGKHITQFSSFDEAIDTISHYFANRKERGIETLDAIGSLYNPGNVNNWKQNVALVMSHL